MELDDLLREAFPDFVAQSEDIVRRATAALLALEKARGGAGEVAKAYEGLARDLHTLKGDAATLGLADLADLAHRMEDLLAPSRKLGSTLPGVRADALLAALDAYLARARAHTAKRALPDLAAALAGLAAAGRAPGTDPAAAPPASTAAGTDVGVDVGATSAAMVAPFDAAAAAPEEQGGWRVAPAQIGAIVREVERLRELRLRLDQRRADVERAAERLDPDDEMQARLVGLGRSLGLDGDEAGAIVGSLEEGLRAVLTLPLRTILDPLHRAVRGLARQLGKEARLRTIGAEISLDRRVLEALRGPLNHLARNAVDHGIEAPAARARAGKPREGTVSIAAEQQGNVVSLEIGDDGGGIDAARVREEAVRRGLVASGAASLSGADVAALVMRGGFSTRAEVTQTSGRGVGLSAARVEIEALGGTIEIASVPGRGTRCRIAIPLELGGSPVLLVRCGDLSLGVPMGAVESIRPARPQELRLRGPRTDLVLGDDLVPLEDLGGLLALREPAAPAPGQPLMVVRARERRRALAVDEVLGDRELMIRPLPPEVRDIPAYQGGATMARGEVLLVLRPGWLVGEDGAGE